MSVKLSGSTQRKINCIYGVTNKIQATKIPLLKVVHIFTIRK